MRDTLLLKYKFLLYILIYAAYILIQMALYQNILNVIYFKADERRNVILRMRLLHKEKLLFRDFNWIWILSGHATEERTHSRMHDKH